MFIRNVKIFLSDCMATHPSKQYSSITTVSSMEDLRAAVLSLVSVSLNGEKSTYLFSQISNSKIAFQLIINVVNLVFKMFQMLFSPRWWWLPTKLAGILLDFIRSFFFQIIT